MRLRGRDKHLRFSDLFVRFPARSWGQRPRPARYRAHATGAQSWPSLARRVSLDHLFHQTRPLSSAGCCNVRVGAQSSRLVSLPGGSPRSPWHGEESAPIFALQRRTIEPQRGLSRRSAARRRGSVRSARKCCCMSRPLLYSNTYTGIRRGVGVDDLLCGPRALRLHRAGPTIESSMRSRANLIGLSFKRKRAPRPSDPKKTTAQPGRQFLTIMTVRFFLPGMSHHEDQPVAQARLRGRGPLSGGRPGADDRTTPVVPQRRSTSRFSFVIGPAGLDPKHNPAGGGPCVAGGAPSLRFLSRKLFGEGAVPRGRLTMGRPGLVCCRGGGSRALAYFAAHSTTPLPALRFMAGPMVQARSSIVEYSEKNFLFSRTKMAHQYGGAKGVGIQERP